jgi:hypothetical protein
MVNLAGVSRKVEDAYPTIEPGSYSQFLMESELLIISLVFCVFCFFGFSCSCCVGLCFPCFVFVCGF